jgi:hypothetical protein
MAAVVPFPAHAAAMAVPRTSATEALAAQKLEQGRHCGAPVAAIKEAEGHTHAEAPFCGAIRPAGQGRQVALDMAVAKGEKVLTGHGVHALDPCAAKLPVGHGVHSADSLAPE